ncbi:acetyltransferase [Rhodoferax aquaticus]|uniref:Acetyltransferase n=1 Tax=Rhodoferax aquaticus TaxID=2527691 RepID=A0A515EP87_9BURK|nr:acetyltransferase [Rhodoferax aquaticus]QDL54440.1 acetyltransferase [Rhodoferax aquaticus]
MKKKLVIFGSDDIGELAHFYFSSDSDYEVVAFTLDAEFIKQDRFCGVPVIPFSQIGSRCPPESHEMFVALGYSKVNAVRKEKYFAAKSAGYGLASYISSMAIVYDKTAVGDNCFIFEDNTVQPFAKIGSNVTLWSGNHIGHHSTINDHTFIASHVVISGRVTVGEQCFIGVNATLRDHIAVGDRCVIGAGVLLLNDAEADGLYIGKSVERSSLPSTRLKRI